MVECTGLENRSLGNGTVGSNPTLSAFIKIMALCHLFLYTKRKNGVRTELLRRKE